VLIRPRNAATAYQIAQPRVMSEVVGRLRAWGELDWAFRGWEVVEAGALSVRELRRLYLPVYPGVHIPRDVEFPQSNALKQRGCGRAATASSRVCQPRRCWARTGSSRGNRLS
jgi:hypothetical protein